MKRRAFTLVELLVVIAVLAILMGTMAAAVNQARRRAKIAKATQEAKEMTNAILAYENYADDYTLDSKTTGGWTECTEGAIGFLLGGESNDGGRMPVFYNAAIRNGSVRDPWGNAYQYCVRKTGSLSAGDGSGRDLIRSLQAGPALPNFNRLAIKERGIPERGKKGK